jgi:putative transposase
MPRKPRMYLPDVPCHVIQRGNNRSTCFFTDNDRRFYLHCLGDACRRYRVDLHAYVLMTNHVHLLMSPRDEQGISKVMQSIGRRYVQRINLVYQRVGTLWEGRHKSSLVDAESYLLACHRYIELNPVRARMVVHPCDYPWSSYSHNAGQRHDPLITEHAVYFELGPNEEACAVAYRQFINNGRGTKIAGRIRAAARSSMPLGDTRFRATIERRLRRSIGRERRGRPSNNEGDLTARADAN